MKTSPQRRFRNSFALVALLLAPLLVLAFSRFNPSGAQERRPSQRQQDYRLRQGNQHLANFKSGGERSEIILKEIAATLKTIDSRLEKLEKNTEAMNLLKHTHNQVRR